MTLTIIANIDSDLVLSVDGKLAYPIPADLAHFKKATLNSTVLVGKNTYQECKNLPNRNWVLLTRENSQSLLKYYSEIKEEVFVGGGAAIYQDALRYTNKLLLSRPLEEKIFSPHSKLTFFPSWPFKVDFKKSAYDKRLIGCDIETWYKF
jgi:dihydrofolate reductase